MPIKNWLTNIKTFGKVILSGEHSVVYGAPAIAVNIPLFITGKIQSSDQIAVTFQKQTKIFLQHELLEQYRSLNQKYEAFLNGHFKITAVLTSEWDLIVYLLGLWLTLYPEKNHFHLTIALEQFPLGCGLGGSAAIITLVLKSLSSFFLQKFDTAFWFKFAQQAENLQHGKSSGLDLWVSFHEKACWFQNHQFKSFTYQPDFTMINTGKPQSSTGECVTAVAQTLKRYLPQFTRTTTALYNALLKHTVFNQLISQNHQLLVALGVVPEKIQQFISTVETLGGYGKITGAGSLKGEAGGIVIVWNVPQKLLIPLVQNFGYTILCK